MACTQMKRKKVILKFGGINIICNFLWKGANKVIRILGGKLNFLARRLPDRARNVQ